MVTPNNDALNNLACTAQEFANSVVTDRQAMVICVHANATSRRTLVQPIPQGALDEAVA